MLLLESSPETATDIIDSLTDNMEFVARLESATEAGEEIEDEESCYDDSSDGNRSEALL